MLAADSCTLCGSNTRRATGLCAGCEADLPRPMHPCPVCARPMGAAAPHCGDCARHPAPYGASRIPFLYRAPIDRLVQALKFDGELRHAGLLGHALATLAVEDGRPLPALLIPVPLHPRRLRQRGFNQSLEIARVCGRALGIPVATNACRRRRDTRPQMELDAGERRRNVKDAFEVSRLPAIAHVAIVDDVVTTGQTAGELARALGRHGVTRIEVWAAARAGA